MTAELLKIGTVFIRVSSPVGCGRVGDEYHIEAITKTKRHLEPRYVLRCKETGRRATLLKASISEQFRLQDPVLVVSAWVDKVRDGANMHQ